MLVTLSVGSLNSLLNKRFLTMREIIKYALDFLSGVHFVHTKRLAHFDIKPTNVLINNSNVAVLTDFGLSKRLDQYGFATPEKMYTPHTPPEYLTSNSLDTYSDIYQCGFTLYRMCNGNGDYEAQWNRGITGADIENERFPDRDAFLPHIPKAMRNVIKKALTADISKRYDTVLEMINDLSKIDKLLDWTYTENDDMRTSFWFLKEERTTKQITLHHDSLKLRGIP